MQNLTAIDVLGERKDGGMDAAIVAATPIDGSASTLQALATKVRNYAADLSSSEFLAEHPLAKGRLRIVICAHGPIDLTAQGLIQSLVTEVNAKGVKLEVEHVLPHTSWEPTRDR